MTDKDATNASAKAWASSAASVELARVEENEGCVGWGILRHARGPMTLMPPGIVDALAAILMMVSNELEKTHALRRRKKGAFTLGRRGNHV